MDYNEIMPWKTLLHILLFFSAAAVALLDYKWHDKRTNKFKVTRAIVFVLIFLLLIINSVVDYKDDQARIDEKAALMSEIGDLKELSSKDMKLAEELLHASGMHSTFPRFYFFRGTHVKMGTAKALGSTISILIENPGDYPIYDLDIQIEEVSESEKWLGKIFSGKGTSLLRTDSAGNVVRPDFVSANLHITALQARSMIQREIPAPPRTGKNNYAYIITLSARNGMTKYRYNFIPKGASIGTPLKFYDFYAAYKILRLQRITQSDGTIAFKNTVVEEYHDPQFPTSLEGTIDYGPNLLSVAE